MKLNVSLDDQLVERMDIFAERNYMSRSGLISLAVTQYLNTNEMVLAVKDMSLTMRKIADTSTIDAATVKQLEDFERVCKMLTGQF